MRCLLLVVELAYLHKPHQKPAYNALTTFTTGDQAATGCRAHQRPFACGKLHFRRLIFAWTEPGLGNCSYLDTCRHMKGCKYIHYELDDATPAAGRGLSCKTSPCPVWCGPHQLALLVVGLVLDRASYTGSFSGLYVPHLRNSMRSMVQDMLLFCICARPAVAAACMLCSPSTWFTGDAMSWCTCCEYAFCMLVQVLPVEQCLPLTLRNYTKLCSMSLLQASDLCMTHNSGNHHNWCTVGSSALQSLSRPTNDSICCRISNTGLALHLLSTCWHRSFVGASCSLVLSQRLLSLIHI